MAIKKEDVLEYLEKANMLEVSELISDIEDKFGVSAAAPVAVAGAVAGGASDAPSEEKSEFDVELTSVGEKKISVIIHEVVLCSISVISFMIDVTKFVSI